MLDEKYGPLEYLNEIENILEPIGFQIKMNHENIHFKYKFHKDYPFRPCFLYVKVQDEELDYTMALKKAYMKYIYYSNKCGPNESVYNALVVTIIFVCGKYLTCVIL